MKEYINNLNLYPSIKQYGKEFTYTFRIYGSTNISPAYPLITGGYAQVPMFAPIMLESLYSDVTEKIARSINPTGENYGLCNYASPIWSGMLTDFFGQDTFLYPYNQDPTPTMPCGFNMVFGSRSNGIGTPQNYGIVGFDSMNMQYINFLRWLHTEKLLCTNINVKMFSPSTTFNYFSNPVYFFKQELDSSIYSQVTTIGKYVRPEDNATTGAGAGLIKSSIQVDIPCSWIFDKSSGMTFPFPYDMLNNPLKPNFNVTLSFTLKTIN